MIHIKRILILFFFLQSTFLFASKADSIIYFTDTGTLKDIKTSIYIFEDTSSALSFEDVILKNNFTRSKFEVPNLGVSKSTFWIRFSICNNTPSKNLLLQLSYPLLDVADLYYLNSKGIYSIIKAGDLKTFSSRKYKNQNFIYDVSIDQNETKTFYMKINSAEQILIPLYLGEKEIIAESNSLMDIMVGIYIGIILVMFLYNAFIFIMVKDISYLYYIVYILFIGLTQVTLLGYAKRLLWPENLWLASHALYIAAAIGSSCIAIFINSFLKLKTYAPKLVFCIYIIVLLYICSIIAALSEHQHLSYNIIDINGIIISIFCMYVSIKMSFQGYKPARFFLLGWTVFMIGVLIFVLRNFGFFPFNSFTNYTMPAGSALEVALLSLALADRINILKKEKEASQALALHALQQNEMIITNQNIILEKKVGERTKEIEEANSALYKALAELEKADTRLAKTGKLISLDGLSSDNTNTSNIPLKKAPDDIFDLLTKYDMNVPCDKESKIIPLNTPRNTIDYSSIQEEIEQLLSGIEDGATRTAAVVKGLRVFSPLNDTDLKRISVTESIDSILTDLHTEISGTIELAKNFTAIPEIECFPAKLNEVFMNILHNAIQAIKAKKDPENKGLIIISTYSDTKKIYISIKDNGIGMTKEIKSKIFEPFFTTKDIGNGVGLGMSVSLSIISDHNGTIELNTTYGKGTEVILTLPINYTK
ncbi:sensor histidine kinase [Cytophaga hutchinsonii]|uniref:histidine kinase n=1 Tax=Cytophaga hutchinsonii (strain ATCC 33406 / DSM 1761 / CIP 103989 / NBRC 15051 / NCIMB 9469 / D465) TaxID=269798 RepID=A0A6N4SUG4_CYTH3|nr:7TM diverse intracellular signaling domain-containing protein [Cytophaga hutchinsonii]ABG60046.1 sensor kinase of Zn/Pb responsive two-component regulatory system [Cytophaga hutchinsonii ATCC 33406]SFX25138.1 hypothetical protein SAMN04487930_102259 [Cytophaga hutchinsonii ATCC 33406]